ncbi:MAG: bifunctional nuclease family protein [bacterium]|nr:bifunctional nuclease family protein [bacterium]
MTENSLTDVEVVVVGLFVEPGSNAPVVLLRDLDSGKYCMPIWIGEAEAASIASAIRNVPMPRPMTHDLLVNTISAMGGEVQQVYIHSIIENTFLARIDIVKGESIFSIDARPSDGIALAVRTGAVVKVARTVLEVAKVATIAEDSSELTEDGKDDPTRAFASVDKNQMEDILSDLDPKDFKYKM